MKEYRPSKDLKKNPIFASSTIGELCHQTEWQPIETADKDGPPILLFDERLVHVEFCPSGSAVGFWQDDEGWIGAVWCPFHDHWVTKVLNPSHWMALPDPAVEVPLKKQERYCDFFESGE